MFTDLTTNGRTDERHIDILAMCCTTNLLSNIGMTLKSGWGVVQGHWKWHHSIDRMHTSSYSYSIVTMAVCCTVFEIKRYIGWKNANFSYHPSIKLVRSPRTRLNFFVKILIQSVRVPSYDTVQIAETFNPLRGAQQLYRRQTDRQTTDGRTDGLQTTDRRTDGRLMH